MLHVALAAPEARQHVAPRAPQCRCVRLSFVETCTVRSQRSSAAAVSAVSGEATAKLPPIADEDARAAVAHRADRRDGVEAVARAAARSRTRARARRGTRRVGFSVIPIVRSPCTFECPRTGHGPAPGTPMFPRSSSRFTISCTFATPCSCCVSPIAQHAITRSARDVDSAAAARIASRAMPLLRLERRPGALRERRAIRLEARRVRARGTPSRARGPGRRSSSSSTAFAMPLQQRDVAADAHLEVEVRDRGAAPEPAPSGSCGCVKRTSPRSRSGLIATIRAPRRFAACERGEHARVVRARVLADHEDRVGEREVVEPDRALADADHWRERRRRSTRDTCSSSRAGCSCRSSARTAGTGTRPRCWCGPRCRRPPRPGSRSARSARAMPANASSHDDRRVVVDARRAAAAARRAGPAARASGRSARAAPGSTSARRTRRSSARARRLVRDRLRAVLAELGGRALARLGPRAAGAVEAARLVQLRERRAAPRRRPGPRDRRARASRRSPPSPPAARVGRVVVSARLRSARSARCATRARARRTR